MTKTEQNHDITLERAENWYSMVYWAADFEYNVNPIQAGVLQIRFELGGAKMSYPDICLTTNAITTKLGTNVKGHERIKMGEYFYPVT